MGTGIETESSVGRRRKPAVPTIASLDKDLQIGQ
jgi:hypothetical protein